ncbi:MAG: ABC transporter permease [Propionibacteriaceae bacterium]|jgi:peptide/nickel transport system permease protein|nr:ABC transporter permease [Propionibacteriaceae bacterium]
MKKLTVIIGLVCSGLVVVAALVSLVWTPFDPRKVDGPARFAPPGWPHVLGTDAFGIDTASRLLVGAQTTLLVGVVAVALAAVIGVPLGVFVGMGHRIAGEVVARASDILFALPALLLAILLAAALGASVTTAAVAIGIATIPVFQRMARAATLTVMSQDYILAAQVSGIPGGVIAIRHVLPNITPVLGVQAAASFSMAILAEAGLSYLGLSAPQSTPTWGRMLHDANLYAAPIQAVIPGVAIAVAVLGFNLLGDGVRDYLDPRMKELR